MLASTLDKGTLIGRIGECWERSSRRVDMSSRLNANVMSLLALGAIILSRTHSSIAPEVAFDTVVRRFARITKRLVY